MSTQFPSLTSLSQVTWQDEETDPGNPKNWKMRRKAKATFGMPLFVFISLFAVSLVAPILPAIAAELDIENPATQEMVLSVFLLGFAIGPLIASLLSETFGRMRVIQSWNLLYTVFNAVCGVSRTKEAIIGLRFVSGLFASATLGIGGGTISDMFRPKDRGKGIAIYSWCSVAGPLFGVILGGFIAKYTTLALGLFRDIDTERMYPASRPVDARGNVSSAVVA
ncbi:MFS multidrug transporter (polyamine transporter 3) [Colletotrichum sojae]|uniref:MFS multidrug transporter (Polyamine transporter 3) n=1 Tax=Colletotrichum sojae TaxID=2175907 RepID=A0A8H6N388_9PEZI|nr:MFS multidrug transporter (polyamine transporter 3) [Colletotrichum sojae]